MTITEQPLV